MSEWKSTKARQVYRALLRIGWTPVSQSGSHIKLRHIQRRLPDYIWAFHDKVEIGPRMLARIAKHTGLKPADL
ncbi:MAG TPA: type II toxin-antitoxin system HicA family toxin [Candidatus Angelobacter sp.]